MLKYLHIENIAVIEQTDIEFESGFNVLTGETGAGKSIVIDAINAVLGERTSKDLIRSGCDSGLVTALFGDLSEETLSVLKGLDITPDEDGNILVSRRLSLTGKGIIKINGVPFTATALKEISQNLINIHGQHDNQALLNPEKHCGFIDAVAENGEIRNEYYAEFKRLNGIRRELAALETNEEEKQRRQELLKYQIEELEAAQIRVGEITELKTRLEIAEDFEKNLKGFSAARALLAGDDETDGVITKLKLAAKTLSTLKNEPAEKGLEGLNELIALSEDRLAEIEAFAYSLENNEENPDLINTRLDFLYKLMVKYGNSEEKMLEFLQSAKQELESITFADKREAALGEELERAKERLVQLGDRLTLSRQSAAAEFEAKVCESLRFLNMPDVSFTAEITKSRYTGRGCDSVEFKISANKGEEMKPLHKIASGGELSRVMLSIKAALLGKDSVGTMIFDEIDTGISGFAADKVGVQLKRVSEGRQVICITHLAQIAALAQTHLLIEKNVENGRTKTYVTPLEGEGRIKEIARIMSGKEITENIYNSAKELLDRSSI